MRHDRAGSLEFVVNPAFAKQLAALGLDSPERVLDLPGEIVSGHPDRHVLRVELPGFTRALYLKRQHVVSRRERFRNWRAGFGWVSRSLRERSLLDQLAREGIAVPPWVAAGEDASGRAFLLVEEVEDAPDLRHTLQSVESAAERSRLAGRIGSLIDNLHRYGFTTPDLTAKHLLVSDCSVVPIDWQNARRAARVSVADRVRTLAALDSSIPPGFASVRERLRVLHAALHSARSEGIITERFTILVRRIAVEARSLGARRSIRDQHRADLPRQRLVWVAGEAVCAVPNVAAIWPTPAIAAPFYDVPPGKLSIDLPDGQPAHLIRGRSFDPIGRLWCRLRGKSWRSPGATMGRVLFHLERHGIPAPRLLAFGQRLTGCASAEWFALHTPPAPAITNPTPAIAEQLGRLLRLLHDAGCRTDGDPSLPFGCDVSACVRDVTAVRLVKQVSRQDRRHDLQQLAAALPHRFREAVGVGYSERVGRIASGLVRMIPAGASR